MAARTRERAQALPAHVAGYNLGLLMRLMIGFRTPRGAAERLYAVLIAANRPGDGFIVAIAVTGCNSTSSTGCYGEIARVRSRRN